MHARAEHEKRHGYSAVACASFRSLDPMAAAPACSFCISCSRAAASALSLSSDWIRSYNASPCTVSVIVSTARRYTARNARNASALHAMRDSGWAHRAALVCTALHPALPTALPTDTHHPANQHPHHPTTGGGPHHPSPSLPLTFILSFISSSMALILSSRCRLAASFSGSPETGSYRSLSAFCSAHRKSQCMPGSQCRNSQCVPGSQCVPESQCVSSE
jgi:hypothetical protein